MTVARNDDQICSESFEGKEIEFSFFDRLLQKEVHTASHTLLQEMRLERRTVSLILMVCEESLSII